MDLGLISPNPHWYLFPESMEGGPYYNEGEEEGGDDKRERLSGEEVYS